MVAYKLKKYIPAADCRFCVKEKGKAHPRRKIIFYGEQMDMKRIVVFALALIIALSTMATAAFASSPVDTYAVSKTVGSGEKIVVDLNLLDSTINWREDYKTRVDFTTGSKGYRGSGYIESANIEKNNKLVLTLKQATTLTEERELFGEVMLINKKDSDHYYTVEYTLAMHNAVVTVYGVSRVQADNIQYLFPAYNTVFVCDEDSPGYAIFKEGYLTGAIKFAAGEKIYLNVEYNNEDICNQLYDYLGADFYEDNVQGVYTFAGEPKFSSPVSLSLLADYATAYYLYNWDGLKLAPIEPTFDPVEGELEWEDAAPQTIVLSKVSLENTAANPTNKKNPDTGAGFDVEGAALVGMIPILCGIVVACRKK